MGRRIRGSPDVTRVRHGLVADPELLTLGPQAVLYAVLVDIVDEYEPVVAGLGNDIDEIEDELFGAGPDVARSIYELSREVIEFQRGRAAARTLMRRWGAGPRSTVWIELQRRLRDVQDRVIRVVERVDAFRGLLQRAVSVHPTLVARRRMMRCGACRG